MITTVRNILRKKRHKGVWTIGPNDYVFDAIKIMADRDIGALIVVDEGRIVGIVSERDYSRKGVLHNRSSRTTRISEIMTDMVLFVEPDNTVEECMALMTDRKIRHLPVLDDGELVGIVSV